MALAVATVTLSAKPAASSTILGVYGGDRRQRPIRTNLAVGMTELGRRGVLLSVIFASSTTVPAPETNDSRTSLLQRYLKKSEENKVKNDKERLDDYYKRNYKDYFEFIEGSVKGKKEELSESEKGILDWLQANK